MELLAKLKIDNLYKAKDFTDKDSGVVTKGKWKIQTFDMSEMVEGEQMRLLDVSIPDGTAHLLKDKMGTVVTIPVGTYVSNGRVGYYGLDLKN